jgi:hypothetical protein
MCLISLNGQEWRAGFLLPIALLALSLVGFGCRTVQVQSAADPQTDFTRFHTYNFAPPSKSAGQPGLTEQNRLRIQSAVAAEMSKRSCQLADQPELMFSIQLETAVTNYDKSNPTVQSGSLGSNLNKHYGLLYNKNAGSEPVVNYTEGTLAFRAVETKENRLVWEGLATGVLYQDRPDEQVQKRIHEAVEAVFARFPIPPGRK